MHLCHPFLTDWELNLQRYVELHPEVRVIDSVDGIRTLQNRATMLAHLEEPIVLQARLVSSLCVHMFLLHHTWSLTAPCGRSSRAVAQVEDAGDDSIGESSSSSDNRVQVQAPLQVEIPEGMGLEEALQQLRDVGLQPPLLVKPMWTDGREGSHGLAVLHSLELLSEILQGRLSSDLKPPVMVQQFVSHGGVLYKVRRADLLAPC